MHNRKLADYNPKQTTIQPANHAAVTMLRSPCVIANSAVVCLTSVRLCVRVAYSAGWTFRQYFAPSKFSYFFSNFSFYIATILWWIKILNSLGIRAVCVKIFVENSKGF